MILSLLLSAICTIESDGDVLALNYKDGKGDRNHSFGLCQVTYQTALELGMPPQPSCQRDLRPRYKRTVSSCALFDRDVNEFYAGKYLARKLEFYKGNIRKAVSAYNAGRAIRSNQEYVRKVIGIYQLTTEVTVK